MALINDTDRYHLYYLIVNNIRSDKYDGLSHVAEHALLMPADPSVPFTARGYTCMNHVCLHFVSDIFENLQTIDKKIMSLDAITDENVQCAKNQVAQEIIRLHNKTKMYESLVSFVTESRIQTSAMGDSAEVSGIQTGDIIKWFSEKQHKNQIYRFLFRDAHNMLVSTEIPDIFPLQSSDKDFHTSHFFGDSYLYTTSLYAARIVRIYFPIQSLYHKADIIRKALYEFCIHRKVQASLGIELTISDVFFDTNERFILVAFPAFPLGSEISIDDTIKMIRTEINNICLAEYQSYLKEFINYISQMIIKKESNSEIMNSIKNTILYSTPKIYQEDLNRITALDYRLFPKEQILSTPLKIVIA